MPFTPAQTEGTTSSARTEAGAPLEVSPARSWIASSPVETHSRVLAEIRRGPKLPPAPPGEDSCQPISLEMAQVSPFAQRTLVIRAGGNYAMTPDRALYRAIAFERERIVAVSSDPNGVDAFVKAGAEGMDAPDPNALARIRRHS